MENNLTKISLIQADLLEVFIQYTYHTIYYF